MSQPRITYQPALDGLRALAVGAVIAYHLGYPWAQGGFLGVDAFFVLSGFLITSLLVAERSDTGRVSLKGFWSRRARRLLPAVFIMLTAVCIYAAYTIPPLQLGTLRGDAFASLFYFANWHFIAADQSYFAQFLAPLPLTHLWSLAIEEQFYLLWPVIVIGLFHVGRGTRRALWIGTIVGIIGSQIAMSVLYTDANPSRAYYGTESRVHTILIGCLLALILRARPDLPARMGKLLQGLGVLTLAIVIFAFNRGRASAFYFNGGSLLFATAVAVVIAAAIAPTGILRRVFAVPLARYVGRISYGLYLWHWPVIVFMTEQRVGFGGTRLNLVRIAVTFAITAASFHLIEQPILQRRGRVAGARALLPIGVSVVIASVLIGTAGATSLPRAAGRVTGVAIGRCGAAPGYETRAAARELARLGGITAPPPVTPRHLAVFGDSRACSLLTGLEVGAAEVDAKVANGTILGCGIVAGAISERYPIMPRAWALSCERRVNQIVDRTIAASKPDLILWLSGWELNDLDVGNHDAGFGTPEHRQVLLDRMEALYRRSQAPGRKLVILTLPEESPGSLYQPDPRVGAETAILNQINRDFVARHPQDVAIVDLARRVCPQGQPCSPRRSGIHPRPLDGIHFSPEGSAWAAQWLWPQLLAIWPVPASG